jgi:hypothetical protein
MDLPPLDNQTEFTVHPQLALSKQGEVLQCLVKATFELHPGAQEPELAPADRARPLRFADVPWGEPDKSSVAYPSDACIRKPGTDVVVAAVARAPGGQATPSFDAFVRVGHLSKAIRLFGMRIWQANGDGLSSPRPVTEVEVRYDNAWGGVDDSDPSNFVEEARNPMGRGVAAKSSALTHQLAPCIEDPDNLIRNARTRPPPAGLGPLGRHWEPRRKYVGTYDEAWKETRSPLPPLDQDDRMELCASPGLVSEVPLVGGEECSVLNLHPWGPLQFRLPRVALGIEFVVEGRAPHAVAPHLDTVLIDLLPAPPNPPVIELVWRAAVPAPRRMKQSLTIVREHRS